MGLTLTIDITAWRTHVHAVAAAHPGLVPVVKGNGYGFGRARLAAVAAELGVAEVAVGTVHELADVPADGPRRLVLVPALARELRPLPADAVLTVGSLGHVAELEAAGAARARPVLVKLQSSMRRYGTPPGELPALLDAVHESGATVHGFAAHPPLAGSADDHFAECERWLDHLPPGPPLYVSHLDPDGLAALSLLAAPDREVRVRSGTELWHGDKSMLHLAADVADVHPVRRGEPAGYRLLDTPGDGHLVLVSAGTAQGVHPLPDGRSPLHFARRRLALLEPPHMHTSIAFVPAGDPVPAPGDTVDVQRPLIHVLPDRVVERDATGGRI
jgi:alanine racemase